MSQHVDITEVSDPRNMTIDVPVETAVPVLRVLKGHPNDEEVAALVAVLSTAVGPPAAAGPQELNLWGHPVDKLRYTTFSWHRVALVERTHMRR